MIVVISLVVGITDALSMPSFQTIVPSIVERDQITCSTLARGRGNIRIGNCETIEPAGHLLSIREARRL
jgi:hypothetical protein